jgi:LysM repeat protein
MRHKQLQFALLLSLILALVLPATVFADGIIHTVQPGENLFRIGLKYGVGWQAIMQANGLASTNIYAGQQLKIPAGGAAVATAPAAAASAPAASSSTYTVQRGDTLFRISLKFGITMDALIAANRLADPTRIYAGQLLTIPGSGGGGASVAAAPAPASATTGNLILVDKSEQRMYVYEGGVLKWAWVTSTGERGRETAIGRFSVLNKIPNAYASTWNLQMPYWLGIYWAGPLQNGIHALPILANGATLWEGYLGTPVSYGCVILSTSNARTLYEWAAVGTPVHIQW